MGRMVRCGLTDNSQLLRETPMRVMLLLQSNIVPVRARIYSPEGRASFFQISQGL
jgi:hypothetical protein